MKPRTPGQKLIGLGLRVGILTTLFTGCSMPTTTVTPTPVETADPMWLTVTGKLHDLYLNRTDCIDPQTLDWKFDRDTGRWEIIEPKTKRQISGYYDSATETVTLDFQKPNENRILGFGFCILHQGETESVLPAYMNERAEIQFDLGDPEP